MTLLNASSVALGSALASITLFGLRYAKFCGSHTDSTQQRKTTGLLGESFTTLSRCQLRFTASRNSLNSNSPIFFVRIWDGGGSSEKISDCRLSLRLSLNFHRSTSKKHETNAHTHSHTCTYAQTHTNSHTLRCGCLLVVLIIYGLLISMY